MLQHLPTLCEQAERELESWDNSAADSVIEILRWTDLAYHSFDYCSEVGVFSVMQIKRITKMLIEYKCPGIIEYMWSTQQDSSKAQKNIEKAHEEYEKTRLLWSIKDFFKQYWDFITNIEQFKNTWYSNSEFKESIYSTIASIHSHLQRMCFSSENDIIMRHNFKNVPSYLEQSWLNDTEVLSSVLDMSQYAYYFLESYYISNIEDREKKEAFTLFTKPYSLTDVIDIASKDLLDWYSNIDVNISISQDSVQWLAWDTAIFINNIIDNAITRWGADKIKVYQSWDYLCITDNGRGIDLEKFPDPNMIFKKGESGHNSTWIGLSDLEKRGIDCSVSNEGLLSKYQDPNWEEDKKGALFQMKLNFVKTPTAQ